MAGMGMIKADNLLLGAPGGFVNLVEFPGVNLIAVMRAGAVQIGGAVYPGDGETRLAPADEQPAAFLRVASPGMGNYLFQQSPGNLHSLAFAAVRTSSHIGLPVGRIPSFILLAVRPQRGLSWEGRPRWEEPDPPLGAVPIQK